MYINFFNLTAVYNLTPRRHKFTDVSKENIAPFDVHWRFKSFGMWRRVEW